MLLFLLKGLVRDRSRSLFPTLTVIAGVALTVILYSWVKGTETDVIRANASFATGHVRVTTRGYAAEADPQANDLALRGLGALLEELRRSSPGLVWAPRIRFGGLADVPDAAGETRAQAPIAGLAVDLLSPAGEERRTLNLDSALRKGRLPSARGEALLSDVLFDRLGLRLGDTVTLISSTPWGSVATANLAVVGTVRFGVSAMDRGAMLLDLADAQAALDMEDAAAEVLGLFPDGIYREDEARALAAAFNGRAREGGELAPAMADLRSQPGLATILDLARGITRALIAIFVGVMSIVLWNAGLMGSLRRYGEIGVRLALGEPKGHVYRSMIAESMMIGLAGSLVGTALGLAVARYLQVHGLDVSFLLKNSSMLISDVLRARVTPTSAVIGFVPGLFATLLGTLVSGIGIYRRQTAQLAKELEA
ncbi:MAG TPA: FtsX-like permease family protein [Vicinamibacteria bacterium]|nr:FtsX-like permease family protein [Vicinamibacteria bacterium]